MGLDIQVKKIKREEEIINQTPAELFNSNKSTYCNEWRNLWSWLSEIKITKKEVDKAVVYRIITKKDKPTIGTTWQWESVDKLYDTLDEGNFIYIVKFDW